MNKIPMLIPRALLALILSLSATMIYAEVSTGAVTTDKAAAISARPLAQSVEESATAWRLYAEQWELARSGETILSLPVLKQVIQAWLTDKSKKIEIQYPGGEDGEFWVQELADWLVALGIPSKYMVITPGSGADDVIKFDIIK